MKEQEAKNDKLKEELLAINKENVEIHQQGVIAQTAFQEVLLKMLKHTLESAEKLLYLPPISALIYFFLMSFNFRYCTFQFIIV